MHHRLRLGVTCELVFAAQPMQCALIAYRSASTMCGCHFQGHARLCLLPWWRVSRELQPRLGITGPAQRL